MVTPILNNIVNTIVESVSPQKVILFGSRARRNHQKKSDYDFMVIKKGVRNEREVSRRIYKALFEKRIGQAVDVIVVTPEQVERYRNTHCLVIAPALREGKEVYHARALPS